MAEQVCGKATLWMAEKSMPLTRSKDQVLTTMMGVKFLMCDGDMEVACRAERELLRYRFGSRDRDSDEESFKLHREAIEKAASDKYDAGMTEAHTDATVVVTDADLASPLSRKF
jgi:Protein of unknown function (DUF1488)